MTFEEWFDRYIELFTDEDMPANDKLRVAWNGGYSYGIKAATEAAAPKWVSVEERLPEQDKALLAVYDPKNDTWYRHDFFRQDGLPYWATHWMELPPAPQGEGV